MKKKVGKRKKCGIKKSITNFSYLLKMKEREIEGERERERAREREKEN